MRTLIRAAATAGCLVASLVSAQAAGDLSPAANQAFLMAYAARPGVMTTASGLQYRILRPGEGRNPSPSDRVVVAYTGKLIDGAVFDKTGPAETRTFTVSGLIPGWKEALGLMKEGDEWEIVVPSELGYGEKGSRGDIPPNQTLVFYMRLIAIK